MNHSAPEPNSQVIRFIQAGKHRVCYAEGGVDVPNGTLGSKPRVLLLHGWISSHHVYRECWADLGEMARYCALDLVGFGESDKPSPKDVPYDPDWYCEQLKAFVDAVDWDNFILIAHSMGGVVATEFAIAHPQLVDRLILIDSVGIPQPPPLLGRILQLPIVGSLLFRLLAGTRKSLRDFLVKDVWYSKPVVEEAVLGEMYRAINSPGGKEAAYASMMQMTSPRAVRAFTPRFSALRTKTHLIWGDHDKLFPLDACGLAIQKLIPGATLDVIKDSGHEPQVEAPDQFLRILRKIVQPYRSSR